MELVDSHAHLQSEAFGSDRAAVIEAARAGGIRRLLVPAWDRASSESAVGLSTVVDWVDAAVGIHPHEAAVATEADWEIVERLAGGRRVVAIGETGLDYDRLHSPRDAQLDNLRRHLRLAAELDKPVILHCRSAAGARDAQDDLLAELRATPARAVLHSYSGPVDYAVTALELGAAISFSGLVFRSGEEASAEVAKLVPAEKLLVETDSPFLPPPGVPRSSGSAFRGRRNSPEWVRLTAAWVAERRGEPVERLGEALVQAYDATFRADAR